MKAVSDCVLEHKNINLLDIAKQKNRMVYIVLQFFALRIFLSVNKNRSMIRTLRTVTLSIKTFLLLLQ